MPPVKQVTFEYLKAVFVEEKAFLKKVDVSPISVPKYDELSVKNLWEQLKSDPAFNKYFANEYPKDKGPDRTYFFNVLNTVHPFYLKAIKDHATEQRFSATGEVQQRQVIHATDRMMAEIAEMPFVPGKCPTR